ncbi:MAG TPA: translocation/assembly module TamB domain-containing protein [Stellaceae bacterium]|nr:translocation/assembly module TamB domain-containing protein [Stellaceae bacterium]
MRRPTKIALWAAGLTAGLPLFGLAVLLIGANTDGGRRLIERAAADFSQGMVTIDGLSGRFPDRLHAGRIVVNDPQGTWLTIDEARIDWSPLRLLHGEAKIDALTAAHVAVARRPAPSAATASSSGGGNLPLRIAVDRLDVARLDLAAPVAGVGASLAIKGHLDLQAWDEGSFSLDGERLNSAGSYHVGGTVSADKLAAQLAVDEPARGLVSAVAGMPELGPLSVAASLDGPRHAEALRVTVSAGPLQGEGHGKIDLVGKALDVDLAARAPAMTPRPDLSWQSATLDAHVHGAFTSPAVQGHLDIAALRAGGGSVGQIAADIRGDNGAAELNASVRQLRIPGASPDLFVAAPFELHAHAALDAPRRPVAFTLSHPLVAASGAIDTGGALAGSVKLTIPSFAPFAALAGADIQGSTTLTATLAQHGDATDLGVDGTFGVTGGPAALVALLGDHATLTLAGSLHGGDLTLGKLAVEGKALTVSTNGTAHGGAVDLDWQAALPDLSALSTAAAGTLAAHGHIGGPLQDLAASARITTTAAIAGRPKENLTVSVDAQGLPAAPSGKIAAEGSFAGSPVQLSAAVSRDADGTFALSLDRLQWKSASGEGRLTLAPGAAMPLGHLHLKMAALSDLAPLTGLAAKGSLDAAFDTVEQQGKPQVRIHAVGQNLAVDASGLDRLTLDAQIADPITRPALTATATADGIRQGALTGDARLTANGGLEALGLKLAANLRLPQGPATLSATTTARLPQHDLQVSALEAGYGGQTMRLLAPARIDFGNGLAVDGLRLGVGGATVALSGRVTPALNLTVAVRDVTPALAKPFAPKLDAAGTLAVNAELRGTLAAPEGTLRLTGHGLRLTNGLAGGVPAADINATVTLAKDRARIDTHLTAGKAIRLALTGTAPLQAAAPLALQLSGNIDLAVLDPLLTPGGRAARGQATIAVGIAGTAAAPRASGTVRLAHGSVQDYVQGFHLTDLTGTIQAEGNTIRIAQLGGKAGSGTLTIAGTVGVLEPNIPVSLTVTARNAHLLQSDLVSATADADLTLRGEVSGTLSAGGTIRIAKAEINVPDGLPQGVATLNVRRPGAKPAPAAAAGPTVGLALTVDAPGQLFVRGHGLDAEMGGRLKVGGTSAAPAIDGGFELRHGTFSLAGQTLTFTSGKVAFGGTGVTGKLDPTLDFVAETTANNLTATLSISGYADAPKLKLSSSPELPQDEILGQLLFGQSTQRLSPFQVAALAQGLASFGGGGGGGGPLASVRGGLGLDRLSVGQASGVTSGATVEAGKYVANGVYVGARQGTSGGSQAQVQIDLTKHLKLQTTLGTGGTPATGITPENDPGSSIGLTYGFEY